jgi:outer membrane protein assembly factor BamB
MKSPIFVTNIFVTNRKQTASVRMVGWMLAIAPLWLMLAAANTSQAQTTSSPADWTQFHRDNMQRWNPYETVLGVNNVGKLGLKWRAPFGTNTLSSPSVVNGVVYVGANDGKLSAMNANTGVTLWSYATGGRINSSPAVADGAVYFGSWDNKVYAVNATTGVLL